MLLVTRDNEMRAEGRAEGIAEGRAEGIAEGRSEGRAEGEIIGAIKLYHDELSLFYYRQEASVMVKVVCCLLRGL